MGAVKEEFLSCLPTDEQDRVTGVDVMSTGAVLEEISENTTYKQILSGQIKQQIHKRRLKRPIKPTKTSLLKSITYYINTSVEGGCLRSCEAEYLCAHNRYARKWIERCLGIVLI